MAGEDDFFIRFGSNAETFATQLRSQLKPAKDEVRELGQMLQGLDRLAGKPDLHTNLAKIAAASGGTNGNGTHPPAHTVDPSTPTIDTSKIMGELDAVGSELRNITAQITRTLQGMSQLPEAAKAFVKDTNRSSGQTARVAGGGGNYVHPTTGAVLGNRDPAKGPIISNADAARNTPGAYRMGQDPAFARVLTTLLNRTPAPALAPVSVSALSKVQLDQGGFDRVVKAIEALHETVKQTGVQTARVTQAPPTAAPANGATPTAPANTAAPARNSAADHRAVNPNVATPAANEESEMEALRKRLAESEVKAKRLLAMAAQVGKNMGVDMSEVIAELEAEQRETATQSAQLRQQLRAKERETTGMTRGEQKAANRAAAAANRGPDLLEGEFDQRLRVLERINLAGNPQAFQASVGRGAGKLSRDDLMEVAQHLTGLGFPVKTSGRPKVEELTSGITSAAESYHAHFGGEIPESLKVGRRIAEDKVSQYVRDLLGGINDTVADAARAQRNRETIRLARQVGHLPKDEMTEETREGLGRTSLLHNQDIPSLGLGMSQELQTGLDRLAEATGLRPGAHSEMWTSGGSAVRVPRGMSKGGSYNDVFGYMDAQSELRERRVGLAKQLAENPNFDPRWQPSEEVGKPGSLLNLKKEVTGSGEQAEAARLMVRELRKGIDEIDELGRAWVTNEVAIEALTKVADRARTRLEEHAQGGDLAPKGKYWEETPERRAEAQQIGAERRAKLPEDPERIKRIEKRINELAGENAHPKYDGLTDTFQTEDYRIGLGNRDVSRLRMAELEREAEERKKDPANVRVGDAMGSALVNTRLAAGTAETYISSLPGARFNKFKGPYGRIEYKDERGVAGLGDVNQDYTSLESSRYREHALAERSTMGEDVGDELEKAIAKTERKAVALINSINQAFGAGIAPDVETLIGRRPMLESTVAGEERRTTDIEKRRDATNQKPAPQQNTAEQLAGQARRYNETTAELEKIQAQLLTARNNEAIAESKLAAATETHLSKMSAEQRAEVEAAREATAAAQQRANLLNRQMRADKTMQTPDVLGGKNVKTTETLFGENLKLNRPEHFKAVQAGLGEASRQFAALDEARMAADEEAPRSTLLGTNSAGVVAPREFESENILAYRQREERAARAAAESGYARVGELTGVGTSRQYREHDEAATAAAELAAKEKALARRLQEVRDNLGNFALNQLNLAVNRARAKIDEILKSAPANLSPHEIDTDEAAAQRLPMAKRQELDALRDELAQAENARRNALGDNQQQYFSELRTTDNKREIEPGAPRKSGGKGYEMGRYFGEHGSETFKLTDELRDMGLNAAQELLRHQEAARAEEAAKKKNGGNATPATQDQQADSPELLAKRAELRAMNAAGVPTRGDMKALNTRLNATAKDSDERASVQTEIDAARALRADRSKLRAEISALKNAGGSGGSNGGGAGSGTAGAGGRSGGFNGETNKILSDILTVVNGIHKTIQTGVKVTGSGATKVDAEGNPVQRKSRVSPGAVPQAEYADAFSEDETRRAKAAATQQRRIERLQKDPELRAKVVNAAHGPGLVEDARQTRISTEQAHAQLQAAIATDRLDDAAKRELATLRQLNREGADAVTIAKQQAEANYRIAAVLARQGANGTDIRYAQQALLSEANVRLNPKTGAEESRGRVSMNTVSEVNRTARQAVGFQQMDEAMAGEVPADAGATSFGKAFQKMFKGGFWNRVVSSTGTFLVRNFTAGMVFGLTNALQDVVSQALKTETTFIRVSNALDQTGKSSTGLRSALSDISSSMGVSLNDVYDTAGKLVGLFDNVPDLANATKVSSQLQIISDGALNANEAVGILASTIGGFGKDVSIGHIADVLTSVQNTTGQNVEVTAEAVGRMSGLAKELNISYEQSAVYGAQIAKLTNQTGGAAGEQFSRILSSLQTGRGRTTVAKAFGKVDGKDTGISAAMDAGQYGKVLEIMTGNWDKLSDAQKRNVSTTVAGQRQASAFAALMANGVGTLNAITKATYSNGQADDKVAKLMQTLGKRIAVLRTDFQNLADNLVRTGILNFLGLVIGAGDKLIGVFNKFLNLMNGIADSNPFLSFLRKAGGGLLGMAATVFILRKAIAGLNATFQETAAGKGMAKLREQKDAAAIAKGEAVAASATTRGEGVVTTRRGRVRGAEAGMFGVPYSPGFRDFGDPSGRYGKSVGHFQDTENGASLHFGGRGNVGSPFSRMVGFGLDHMVGRPAEIAGAGLSKFGAAIKSSQDAVETESRARGMLARLITRTGAVVGGAGGAVGATARGGRSLFQGRADQSLAEVSDQLTSRAEQYRRRADAMAAFSKMAKEDVPKVPAGARWWQRGGAEEATAAAPAVAAEEPLLFHGTGPQGLPGQLLPRDQVVSHTGQMLGPGIYGTPEEDFARFHAGDAGKLYTLHAPGNTLDLNTVMPESEIHDLTARFRQLHEALDPAEYGYMNGPDKTAERLERHVGPGAEPLTYGEAFNHADVFNPTATDYLEETKGVSKLQGGKNGRETVFLRPEEVTAQEYDPANPPRPQATIRSVEEREIQQVADEAEKTSRSRVRSMFGKLTDGITKVGSTVSGDALRARAEAARQTAQERTSAAHDARARAAGLREEGVTTGPLGPFSGAPLSHLDRHGSNLGEEFNQLGALGSDIGSHVSAGHSRILDSMATVSDKAADTASKMRARASALANAVTGSPASSMQERGYRLAATGADLASRAAGKLGETLKALSASGMMADIGLGMAIAALTAYFTAQSEEARLNQDVKDQIKGRWGDIDNKGNKKKNVEDPFLGPSSTAYNQFADETKGKSDFSVGLGVAKHWGIDAVQGGLKAVTLGAFGNPLDNLGQIGSEQSRQLGIEGDGHGGHQTFGMSRAKQMEAQGKAQLDAVTGGSNAIARAQDRINGKFKQESDKIGANKNLSARQKEAALAMLDQAAAKIQAQAADLLAQSEGVSTATRMTTDGVAHIQTLVDTAKLTSGHTTLGASKVNLRPLIDEQLKDTGVDLSTPLGKQLKDLATGGGDSADVATRNEKLLRLEVQNMQANWLAKLKNDPEGAANDWTQLQALLQQLDTAGVDSINAIMNHASTLAQEAAASGDYAKANQLYAQAAGRLKGRRETFRFDPDQGGTPSPQRLGSPNGLPGKFGVPTTRPKMGAEERAKEDAATRTGLQPAVQTLQDQSTMPLDRALAQTRSASQRNVLSQQRATAVLAALRKARQQYGPLAVTAQQIAQAENDVFTSASQVASDMDALATANLALAAAGHWGETQQAQDQVAAAALALSQAQKNGDKAGIRAAQTQKVTAEHSAQTLKEQQAEAAAQARIAKIPQKNTAAVQRATVADIRRQLKLAEKYGKNSTQYQGLLAQLYQAQQSQAQAARSTTQSVASAQAGLAQAIAEAHGDARAAARAGIRSAQVALREARATGTKADIINAQAGLVQANAAYNQTLVDFTQSRVGVGIAIAEAAGNTVKSAQLQLHAARLALAAAKKRAGGRKTAEVNQAEATAIQARASARDAVLQDRLDTVDFNLQMNRITQAGAIAALQQILRTSNLTKQQRRDLLLKIKGMKDQIANDQWNFADIKMPTPYEMRRFVAIERQARAKSMSSAVGDGGMVPIGRVMAPNVTHQTTIQINGADVAKVRKVVEEVVGAATRTRTIQPRRR